MMQIDQLQHYWQLLDQKVNTSIKLQSELMRHVATQSARRAVHRMMIWPILDIVYSVVVLGAGYTFLARHWPELTLIVPAGLIVVAATVCLVDYIRELVCVAQMDWHGSVAGLQQRLSEVAWIRIRRFKWTVLLAPLFGICLAIVTVQWLFDVNLVKVFGEKRFQPLREWAIANVAFAVLFIPAGWLIVRFVARRWSGHRLWQNVLDDLSGSTLRSAREELARWSALQVEMDEHGEL